MGHENYAEAKTERNRSIWRANRVQGVGTVPLARLHGLSRQRIKQIIARQTLIEEENRDEVAPASPPDERDHV